MLPFIWYISTGTNMCLISALYHPSGFATVTLKLTWRALNVMDCMTTINNFQKEKAIFVQPSFIILCCLVPSQKIKLIGAKLSKLG